YHELTPGIKDAIDQSTSAKDTFEAIDQYLKGFDADIVDGRQSDKLERLKKSGFYVSLQAAQRRYKAQIEAVNEKLKSDQVSLPNGRLESSVGGQGGLGGAGGVIDITNGADLTTAGANAYAVLAQSVGGGGGTGGAAYANGSNKINVIQTV